MDEPSKRTLTYKRIDDLDVQADVYPSGADRSPTVVWLHGGALIMEHRDTVPPWLLAASARKGWTLVSIDYRLAPETKLPEIVADVEDAFRWIRGGAGSPSSDPGAIGVVGGSAGGYLSLLVGARVRPRVAAVVAFWGYGELTGEWYARPSPHPVHHEIVLSEEEARRQVAGPPISDDRHRPGNGYAFYQYCRQRGRWPIEVAGWDPDLERDRFVPYMPLENVSPDYPPTLLIHGDDDTDVPVEQSVMMAAALDAHDVEHELLRVEGAEHGLAGADPRTIVAMEERATSFLDAHLRPR